MESKISVGGNFIGSINLAMQQNYVPVIRNLVVNNESEESLANLDLKITFEPEFAKEYTYHIEEIAAGQSVEISPVKIQLKTEFLFSLTEKMVAMIQVELFCGEEKIYSDSDEVELLAFDQWSGLLFMPEIISAFVTPNHPKIAEVIRDASGVLKKWTNQSAFTGYQTRNPNNVKLQMAAIYTAIQSREIVYNNPPASYEVTGQRVRLPHIVLEQKQGTCLDLAVLYAACLEAVGLFPLLFFIKEHAFAGCWLEEETFADCMVDDVSAIEKRIVPGAEEVLLVECTDLVSSPNIVFDKAVKHGKDHFNTLSDFQCVIDVQRSRGSGIRPIPLRLEQACQSYGSVGEENEKEHTDIQAPSMLDSSLLGKTAQSHEIVTKQKIWERKLLDFSLRNTLLNFRVTKNSFQLMTADLSELEDKLADGKDFRIMEIPSEWTLTLRDTKIFEIETEKDLIKSIATEELKSSRIRTFLDEVELDRNLKSLYRSAKMSMEENGTNTLFLAIGFLRWFESDVSEKARYAPIVLIPVDIVRNVRNKGYIIRSRQEEVQINITLLEYLRQDYGINISGLDPLPEDSHGIDLPLVFQTIRQAVMGKKRWNVEEMAFVGLFSFGQFVMWNDIRNRSDELARNKVVSSLMNGSMNWETEKQTITVDNLDTEISVKDMAIPVSADSSQMVAIAAAAGGKSFVLHGPPGTGKSQTITNMIANALYQGKSVLFVAEKMAALNVVQKRLTDIGLDPFCLELHSNKTNKTAVLAELNKTLQVGRIKSSDEYEKTAEKVQELRGKLNDIIEAIHCKREYGSSLYEAIEISQRNLEQKGKIVFEREMLSGIDKAGVVKWKELIRQYIVAIGELDVYANHPLVGYEGISYSIELRDNLQQKLSSLLAEYEEVWKHLEAICRWANYDGQQDQKAILALLKVAEAVMMPAFSFSGIIGLQNFDDIVVRIQKLIQAGSEYNEIYANIESQFESSVFDYPVENAKLQWKQAEMTWFLPKMLKQSKLTKELKLYAKNPLAVTKDNIQEVYATISLLNAKKKEIIETPAELTGLLGGLFMGVTTDWTAVKDGLEKAIAVRNACHALPGNYVDAVMEVAGKPCEDMTLAVHKDAVESFVGKLSGFAEVYEINLRVQAASDDWLGNVAKTLYEYREHLDELRNKVIFNQADRQLNENGLATVSVAYKAGKVGADNLEAAFTGNLYYELSLMTIAGDVRLENFHGKKYNDMIARYKEAIEQYQQLTTQELVARLSAKIPSSGTAGVATSEVGILNRAIKNNGRMMSLRRLFDQIPTLLRRLCPCMLMSPISVAQYIDPSFPKFDLVIFDEASQLPTSEAVGAIARGENVVIVGDPKQLPPTNFFSSNRIDEENSEKEDLESLLDDCLAISMPQESLKWHYRSRHESLIAYSNMKYYDNKLYTFPSPRDLVSEVKMVHLEGFYDKGKTKQNKAEATAIVKEILRRLRDEELQRDSIGVVTFSSVQQNLIDDMLFEEFKKYPELEEIDRNSREPIFIKNLENVQGDERDVILFSVGYGPDAEGNVSMNFGPLNREGGWRRLNVAISRARKSMIVYSVLRSDQINLARTRSEGVAGLKGFLEFAERGKNVLAQRAESVAKPEDYLVKEIAAAITELGYEAKCNIGCSEFKMDIGVVHPENPENYLLGILLDGENCKEASTARDRFVLQPGVLKGLGWNVMRVWTLDWMDDRERVLKEIKAAIDAALNRKNIQKTLENQIYTKIEFEKAKESGTIETVCKQYLSYRILEQGAAEQFYLPQTLRQISELVASILTKEAPISRKLLMHKVLNAWSISRGGSRVENIFNSALNRVEKNMTTDEDREFLWEKTQNPKEYSIYRVEDAEGNKRNMDDIPSEEIINAIIEVLKEQISISEMDLVRETAKKFGFSRLGSVIENTVKYAIVKGSSAGVFKRLANGNVTL